MSERLQPRDRREYDRAAGKKPLEYRRPLSTAIAEFIVTPQLSPAFFTLHTTTPY